MHGCTTKGCIERSHLSCGLPHKNSLPDRRRDGTMPMEESHPKAKHTKEKVSAVALSRGEDTASNRAAAFHVSKRFVSSIDGGATWCDTTGNFRARNKALAKSVRKRAVVTIDDATKENWERMIVKLFNNCVIDENGCILSQYAHVDGGYTEVSLIKYLNKLRSHVAVAIYFWLDCVAPISPEHKYVRHLCNVRICVNPNHLEFGTAKQNANDPKNVTAEYIRALPVIFDYAAEVYRIVGEKEQKLIELRTGSFPCSACSQVFLNSIQLGIHMKDVHTRYACTYEGCDRTFKTPKYLKSHVKTVHLGQRDYEFQCRICKKVSINQEQLDIHMFKNHGVGNEPTRLPCTHTGCTETFLNTGTLKRHLERKHNPDRKKVTCEVCKAVLEATSIRRHMKVLHLQHWEKRQTKVGTRLKGLSASTKLVRSSAKE